MLRRLLSDNRKNANFSLNKNIVIRLPCPPLAKRGGALTHSQALALSKRARDVTALQCSEPLRSKVGGPSKVYAILCGMGPPGDGVLNSSSLQYRSALVATRMRNIILLTNAWLIDKHYNTQNDSASLPVLRR